MQYTLIGFGSLAFLLILFFLPETAHGETPHTIACREMSEREGKRRRFVIYWFNPVKSLGGLRWGNVACIVSVRKAEIRGEKIADVEGIIVDQLVDDVVDDLCHARSAE